MSSARTATAFEPGFSLGGTDMQNYSVCAWVVCIGVSIHAPIHVGDRKAEGW